MSPFKKSLLTSLSLSALFLLTYSLTNHLTTLRTHIPSLPFPFEQKIPFLPLLIIPYMSLVLRQP
jgi:hypothetical protein